MKYQIYTNLKMYGPNGELIRIDLFKGWTRHKDAFMFYSQLKDSFILINDNSKQTFYIINKDTKQLYLIYSLITKKED